MSRRGQQKSMGSADFEAAVRRIDEQIASAKANAALLEASSAEHKELKVVLQDLPKKVTHEVMVPFGPLAFFEGRLEHTNEVLCQLSSEWFALRTTTGAVEMIGRREARLANDRADVMKEVNELETRRRLALGEGEALHSETLGENNSACDPLVRLDENGFMEIREPLGDEGDNDRTHLDATAGAPVLSSAERTAPVDSLPQGSADTDMLARLRELERLEALEGYDREMEELDELVDGYEQGNVGSIQMEEDAAVSGDVAVAARATQEIRSPADLFNVMRNTEETSAVATPSVGSSGRVFSENLGQSPKEVVLTPDVEMSQHRTSAGLAGDIRERTTMPSNSACEDGAEAVGSAPKKLSKFKSDRQRLRG